MYLNERDVEIVCAEINMYEGKGQKIVRIDTVVGDEEIVDDPDEGKVGIAWKDRIAVASEQNKKSVMEIVEAVHGIDGIDGSPHGSHYMFTIKVNDKHPRVAVMICHKNTATMALRIDPDTFEMEDDGIRHVKGWFYKNEVRIRAIPENLNLILECVGNGIKAAKSTYAHDADISEDRDNQRASDGGV